MPVAGTMPARPDRDRAHMPTECRAESGRWPAAAFFFAKRVGGRRFAAVAAVESQRIEQRHQQQHFQAALERRQKPLLGGEQGRHLLHGLFNIDVVERHLTPVVSPWRTIPRVVKARFLSLLCPGPHSFCLTRLRAVRLLRIRHQEPLTPSLRPKQRRCKAERNVHNLAKNPVKNF